MQVSLGWLKEYVDIPWGARQLAERMTMIGAMVEAMRPMVKGLTHVVVGKIVDVEAHPTRETLYVVQVDVGEKTLQSVCGAPNVKKGMTAAVALPGAVLQGMEGPVQEGEIHGVRSEAVLCSEAELGLSEDHSGLMDLPEGLQPGDDFVQALELNDTLMEFEIYPNRPDCLSAFGLAREVAALTGDEVKPPAIEIKEKGEPADQAAQVEVEAADLCPRYMARVIRNVTIGPSPAWLQARIRAAGMRPINNVVDITNFVMMELGQPLHAFDYERLEGRKIVVRRAKPGEEVTTLDGQSHTLDEEVLLICDAERPVAVAGVMGGEDSEVTDQTKHILLESATFDPVSVRKTARRLGMRTEASHRFEKGLHPRLAEWAIDRAAALLAEVAGGEVAPGVIDVASPFPEPVRLSLRPKRVNDVLGTTLSPAEMKRALMSLGFEVDLGKGAERMDVQVPWFRGDVGEEADLIEEIARIHGFDNIPATLPTGASVQGKQSEPLPSVSAIRRRLASAGLYETISYSFISPQAFDAIRLSDDDDRRQAISIANPLSEEMSVMRTTILPGLLQAAATNVRRQNQHVRLFELGKVYIPQELPLTGLPKEKWTLGIIMSGTAPNQVWGESSRTVDFYDLKGLIEAVAETLQIEAVINAATHPALHPGRTAEVTVDGVVAGHFGELHPKVAEAHDLKGRVYVAELDLEPLFSATPSVRRYRPLSRYPAVDRDLALLAPDSVPAEEVEAIIWREGGEYLRRIELFDVYQGKQVPEGYRSLGYTMTFQAEDRTLTDKEIAQVHAGLEAALAERGVTVRS